MNINFFSIDIFDDNGNAAGAEFLKTWYSWKGVVPNQGDIVKLHWGNDEETKETEAWKVIMRSISGTTPNTIDIFCSRLTSETTFI